MFQCTEPTGTGFFCCHFCITNPPPPLGHLWLLKSPAGSLRASPSQDLLGKDWAEVRIRQGFSFSCFPPMVVFPQCPSNALPWPLQPRLKEQSSASAWISCHDQTWTWNMWQSFGKSLRSPGYSLLICLVFFPHELKKPWRGKMEFFSCCSPWHPPVTLPAGPGSAQTQTRHFQSRNTEWFGWEGILKPVPFQALPWTGTPPTGPTAQNMASRASWPEGH